MKRFFAMLLSLCFCICILPTIFSVRAQAQEQPLYEAFSTLSFHMRNTPEDGGRKIQEVESHKALLVLEYGKQWCKVQYSNVTGYCKTKWLYRYRSLKPEKAPVPGYLKQEGFAKVTSPTHASIPGYEGNNIAVGSMLSVHQWNEESTVIHMMRSTAAVPSDGLIFTPYVPIEKARKGDIISGFTSYYNDKTGGRLSKNRQWNIELACSYVQNAVVPAGGTFSYKALCAPFKKSNGYKIAPNISADGEGYGGGVCQLTTTIYNAILNLPLQIEEWAIHKDTGVPYIPRGFDAAVGSYSDFIFTNTLPYDIRLEAMPQNGVLTVLIYRN